MGWILDLLVIAIVAYYAYISAKRGFVRTLIELVGFVAIFLIITKAGAPLSESLFKAAFRGPVLSKVQTTLDESAVSSVEAVTEALPGFVVNGAAFLGIDIDEACGHACHITSIFDILRTGHELKQRNCEFLVR